MEYKPYGFNQGATNIASEELLVGSNTYGQVLDSTTVRLAVDFKCRRSNQPLHKYVGVAKSRAKQGNLGVGQAFQQSQRWMDVTSLSPYHSGNTFFSV